MKFLLAAFLALQANAAPKKGGVFKFAIRVHPETLNPITAHDNYSLLPLRWMSESLLVHDPDTYAWAPALATKYEVSKDGRTYTFELRQGVRFHDGSDMTAEDVAYSFDPQRSHAYGVASELAVLGNFDKVEVLGKYKIRFHAKKALFSNLQDLALKLIVPKHVYEGKSPTKMTTTVVGTGPYRLKEYQQGVRLILEANPDWWGRALAVNKDRYGFDSIIVRFVSDESLKLEMLEKGDLDFAEISADSALKRTLGKPWGEKVFVKKAQHAGLFTTQQSIFVNLRNPMFEGVKTRRALQLLLNRRLLNEKLRGGVSVEATGPWHRLSEYADPSLKPMGFDVKEAARLLREDGWEDPDHTGVLHRVKNGVRQDFRFTLLLPVRDHEKYLTIFQADLKHAGIDMQLRNSDHTLFMKLLDEQKFEAYIIGRGWPGVIDFNPKCEWGSAFTGVREDNNIGYKNAEVDRLMDLAEAEFDRGKRVRLLRKVYRLIAEDQSQVFYFSEDRAYYAHSARLKVDQPSRKYELGIDNWWIE